MKRDMDLIRDILLCFDNTEKQKLSKNEIKVNDKSKAEIDYHIELMKEADLLHHKIVRPDYGGSFRSGISFDTGVRPTMKGYDFLETIRDPVVWDETKSTVKKVGGGALDFVWGIAKEIAKTEIKRRTGFDVG